MNTIKITGAYGTIANYARNGGDIFENDRNNQIMLNYRNYLISIINELSTITFKLYVVYIFLNNISDITKKEIYFFLESLINLPWNISYLERYKHNLRLFLNWLYQENYVEFSGNMVLPKIVHHMKANNRSYYTKKKLLK